MNRHFLLGIAVILFSYGVWNYVQTPHEAVIEANNEPIEKVPLRVQPAVSSTLPEPSPVTAQPASEEEEIVIQELSLEEARRRFAKAIVDAGNCLKIQMFPPTASANPTLDEWLAATRQSVGEPIVHSEDWSVTRIRTPEGEERLIRYEIDYSDSGPVTQKLSYYIENKDGTKQTIPLDPVQSTNPSETFKASLESDGEILQKEKAQRVYFENGDEVVVTEKNDMITVIDMSHGGNTFSCKPFDPNPESCRCR